MTKPIRLILAACSALLLSALSGCSATDMSKNRMFDRLDEAIADRCGIIASHEAHIDSLKRCLRAVPTTTPENMRKRYWINTQLIACYFSYQSDSTLHYLHNNMELAERLGDNNLIVRASSTISIRYSLSGRLFDAGRILSELKDTVNIDQSTRMIYYSAQNRKFRELTAQARADKLEELTRQMGEREIHYAHLAAATCEGTIESFYFRVMAAMRENKWSEALSMCDSIIRRCSSTLPTSHNFARAANHKAQIYERLGYDKEALEWYIQSAIADMRSAVRDYGSLRSVSKYMFKMGNVEQAMRYIRVAINDSQFYNSPKQSYSDMSVLPQIEQAYYGRNKQLQLVYSVLTAVLLLFSVTVIWGLILLWRKNLKLKRIQAALRESNLRLSMQNQRITDANRIKESYIGGFLMIISEYIDKLARSHSYVAKMLRNNQAAQLQKEYAGSNIRSKETKELYAIFDKMFLHLFPDFVGQLNALLREEHRIAYRNDGMLTTELRIYALIRLGINDTTTIASLLQCSVSTVYNYRSAIRRHAREDIDDFDQQILLIGLAQSKE